MNPVPLPLQQLYHDLVQLLREERFDADYANSLFKGPWGALLFMFYYEQYADPTADNATALLEKIYEQYSIEEDSSYAFCSGHTGPFWLLDHLNRHGFLEMDMQYLADDFVTATIVQSRDHLDHLNFDFLHGSSGMCNFLLHYSARPDVAAHLQEFVNAMMLHSKMTAHGRSLPLFYTHEKPVGTFVDAFSLAHGSCSILIILAKIYQAGIAQEQCRQLLLESFPFILHHKNTPAEGSFQALFPAILDGHSINSRLSWCYGDLNVALALWRCGQAINMPAWQEEAKAIMHYNICRNTDEAAGILDNCICHGSGGIAAFYRKFWFETGDIAFYHCASHWQRQAVEKISFDEEGRKHGIKVWQGKDKQWDYAWDLLDGGAGVGLSMLSHLHDTPLAWDECFLLS
ncbi:lanthionine synthetase LanC family protein [Chitinophaga vietnamensis]|uniref:lanthionine synthetase LanC family protein n=1 Tax=Chitinophaga vietnamensis TaxID=2593957 RepID=UPI0013758F0A|nr:lanthionine synthetase LanC family protein [Chitinophaga vietnamensis]